MTSSANTQNLAVETVRVVAHTMGPVALGAQLSQNHWSIYLIVRGGGSVRLNMETNPAPGKDEGLFNVTRHLYELTTSRVRHWDFPTTTNNVTVGKVLRLIGDKRRNRYRMTPTGVGCRHWVLTIISDLAEAGYIAENAARTLTQVIRFNYSRNQQPVSLPMLAGSFY